MAFKTKDGTQKFGNRMKANRYDRAHEGDSKSEKPETMGRDAAIDGEKGPRSEANEVEAKPSHEEIKGVVAEHGPAHEVHVAHDHAGKRSHVHSVHEDGMEHHADHEGDGHVEAAHEHAGHAAGVTEGEQEEDGEGEYPEKHKSATADHEEDDYSVPGL